MNIDDVKVDLVKVYEKSISSSFQGNWRIHPVRIIEAVKSLIGINIDFPNEKLLNWLKSYIDGLDQANSNPMHEIFELEETISLISLEKALRMNDKKMVDFNLSQLATVSDGRPILEFLLELTIQQTGSSFLFTLSALRSNLFLDNKNIVDLLFLSAYSILDDSFKASFLSANNMNLSLSLIHI